jgi:hypothetical protein
MASKAGKFRFKDGESFGDRIVRFCYETLQGGAIGEKQRPGVYRAIVSMGLDADGGAALATIKTSCAIFLRSVWGWCGDNAPRPWKPGWPMFGGWLGSRSKTHKAWVPYNGKNSPEPGDAFFIEVTGTNNNHVGVFLKEVLPGVWMTAEGGGGDGTECAFRIRILDDFDDSTIYDFDPKMKRTLKGWWKASLLGLPEEMPEPSSTPTNPARPTPAPFEWRTLRLATPRMTGPDVKAWQDVLIKDGYGALLGPRQADGEFGTKSENATKTWQRERAMPQTGVVDAAVRSMIGRPKPEGDQR